MKKLIEKIRAKAGIEMVSDEADFMVDDHAGGNIDDAYSMGLDHGEVWFARELLTILEE